jgi:D-serine deaminase-like pyridoxal phosphate-dependent protein
VQDAVTLARLVHQQAGFALLGLQGYAGHVQHILDPGERRAKAIEAAEMLSAAAAALMSDNLPCLIVSGSGTGAHRYDLAGPYSELQAGSYVFMDADYGRVRQDGDAPWPFTPALFVLATVVSANRAGQVTVDAGTKALAVNGPPPAYLIGAPAGAHYAFSGDEHGTIICPPGAVPPPVGARVLIGATHCDPTVNLHAALHAVRADGSMTVMPVVGRYGVRAATDQNR